MRGTAAILALAGVLIAGWCTWARADDEEPPSPERIYGLIRDLGAVEYAVRQNATAELKGIGLPAVPALRQAAQADDPEVFERAREILEAIRQEHGGIFPGDIKELMRGYVDLPATQRVTVIATAARSLKEGALDFLLDRLAEDQKQASAVALQCIIEMNPVVARAAIRKRIEKPATVYEARALAWALPEPKPVGIPAAPRPIKLDGLLDDWKGVRPMPMPFLNKDAGPVQLAWDKDGLYGAVAVKDDAIRVNARTPWLADTFELFIDRDCSRDFVREPRTDLQYALGPGPGEGVGLAMRAFGQAEGEGPRCAWQHVKGGYAMEFFIPSTDLKPAAWRAGTKMGLDFARSDDGRPIEQFYTHKQDNSGWESPILWGIVILEKGEGDEPAPAPAPD